MLVYLSNQRGNIAMAMALAIVGVLSGITLTALVISDTMGARFDFDAIQELHFLRSEAKRGQTIIEMMDYSGLGMNLPEKVSKIASSHSKTTYKMITKIYKENVSTGGGFYFSSGYNVKTLVKANRGIASNIFINANKSMVSKYGEKCIRRSSFAGYHYFTDKESSTNNTPVYFYGNDHIYGKVHSNSDIHIKYVNGWPTFYEPVYTSGVIVPHNGSPAYEQVFKKGYFEHVGTLVFNPTATAVRAYGRIINGDGYDPNKISFVTIQGAGYSSLVGRIINLGPDTTDIWTHYPPRAGNYVTRNRFAHIDTVWAQGINGSLNGGSAWTNHKLWIKGVVSGHQTWCSADNMYLSDDIIYQNTIKGSAPDEASNYNLNDMLGLISEKSIIIQYGYADTLGRHRPNCDGDTEGIFIYGALCALGQGSGDPHGDGVFTFEYQHPHPSTPAVRLANNPYVWDNIDLHRYIYPNTNWPAQIDYPWYNPLWPERFPYMERGTIHLYGSVAQRRRGYVHRSVSDSDYPNPGNIWDIPRDLCGGTSGLAVYDPILGISGAGINAPDATGGGVGYDKDYHFDNRLSFASPPDYPDVHISGGLTPFNSESWHIKKPPSSF